MFETQLAASGGFTHAFIDLVALGYASRQQRLGEWDEVFARIARALAALVAQRA